MKKGKRILGTMLAVILAAGCLMAGTEAQAGKKKDKKDGQDPQQERRVDLNGEYHAALGLQTNTQEWVYRLGYYQDEYYGTEEWSKLATGTYGTDECKTYDGEFHDAVIAGNGTYTVSLENGDFLGETTFSQLQVATDIPDTGAITFSDMIVEIDGVVRGTFPEPYMDKDAYAGGNCTMVAINDWRQDLQGMDGECVPQSKTNSIKVTFTVSGFNYDKEEDTGEGEETGEGATKTEEDTGDLGTSADSPEASPLETQQGSAAGVSAAVIVVIVIAVLAIIGVVLSVVRRKKR